MRLSLPALAAGLVAIAAPAIAAADFQLVRLESKDPMARHQSAKDQVRSDLEQTIAYYNAAIKADPKDDDAYFHRGLANFYAGASAQALTDLGRASKLDPTYAYYPLWIDVINKRGNRSSQLSQGLAQVDMSKWPAPVIRMFLGEATPAEVLAAADDPDPKVKQGQMCEANFYSGQIALQNGTKDEAARLFHLAANACAREFAEGGAARSELAALGENQ